MKKELIVLILLLIFLFGCVKVQKEKSSDVQTVCVTAEDGKLCGGLDFVFGSGYKTTCCVSLGKCCG